MSADSIIFDSWKLRLQEITAKVFQYQMIKPMPDEWCERSIILPESTTKFPGPFKYNLTPYCREMVNHVHTDSPVRYIAVMKSSQCGVTAGVVIPAICYTIDQDPDPILFTAADKIMAGRTIKERLDPILWASKLDHRIRPNAIKKQNRRTGDTEFSKEFAGGTLTAAGTSNPDTFRFYSAKKLFADDFDTAPQEVGDEGDITKLMEGRQKMYGDSAVTYYISTPTVTATSQIYRQYVRGTQKKWHWPCPECGEYFPVEFKVEMEDGSFAGIVYELDADKKLIEDSVHYRTQCCGKGKVYYKDKYKMNLLGTWIATNPKPDKLFESYQLNDLVIPPSFDDWIKVVYEWLDACPPGGRIDNKKLKAFNNQRLGLPFEEMGNVPKSTALMSNMRDYHHGIIPDKTCEEDGNGKIVMITAAFDLGGMADLSDARIDWEIVAHAQTGVTYSVNHGSIGTFKRAHERSKADKDNEGNRMKWTYQHSSVDFDSEGKRVNNSVWPEVEAIIKAIYPTESGGERDIDISAIDTGFFEKPATQFILKMQGENKYLPSGRVYGVKGRVDQKYRPVQRDTQPVRRSAEKPSYLYIVEVNQMKDDLAENMALTRGEGGAQPYGFMNFPQANDGQYTFNNFFEHYEGEVRKVVRDKNDASKVLGYAWEKKKSGAPNHFWDVRVYNLAAPMIYLDLLRRSDPKYKNYTWEDYVVSITE